MSQKIKNPGVLLAIIIGVCLLLGVLIPYGTIDVVNNVTITEKERITVGSGKEISHKYLVFTEDETFENVDSVLFGKFRSSDLQGKLKVGETYNLKVCGYRSGILSAYRNIIRIEE